jgi:hypothetical protein
MKYTIDKKASIFLKRLQTEHGLQNKAMCEALDLTEPTLIARKSQRGSSFSLQDIEKLAKFLRMRPYEVLKIIEEIQPCV